MQFRFSAVWLEVIRNLWCFCSCCTSAPTPPSCRCRRNPTGCRRLRDQRGSPRFHSSSGTRSCDVTWTPRWCSWWRQGRGGSPAAEPPPQRKYQRHQAPPTGTHWLWTTAPMWWWVRCQTWKICASVKNKYNTKKCFFFGIRHIRTYQEGREQESKLSEDKLLDSLYNMPHSRSSPSH